MKVVQIVTNLAIGDAIGNEVLAIHEALTDAGYTCEIMALTIHEKLAGTARNVDFSRVAPEDLAIIHKTNGDAFPKHIAALPCTRVLIYHNITPGRYLLHYDAVMAWNLWRGRHQLKRLARCVDQAWGDSQYNCRELEERGFSRDRLSVLPIVPSGAEAQIRPDDATASRLRARRGTRLLFIGRIAPNKRQEDIIKAYYCYLREEDPEATLYLVGSWNGFEKYYAKLKGFAADLGLRDDQVVFTGHVTEAEKAAYLACADVYVCMSEHEGFCVPLLEAMGRDIPIIAYAACAVPETLGENGLLIREKDYPEIARLIGCVCRDAAFRAQVIERQRESLARFEPERIRAKLLELTRTALANGREGP